MTPRPPASRPALELLDARPPVAVEEREYWRLLGYPADHEPSERARELARWARAWYAEHGRPWVYLREVALEIPANALRLDGAEFSSRELREHLVAAHAGRAMLLAVSAGAACEDHARELWRESKPDEYFFLEMFGSAVVEHLVAGLNGRICDLAGQEGWVAVPHYSPGYTGWDVADQNRLHELILRGRREPWPENLEVLASGMLRPKKSLLGVVGLTVQPPEGRDAARFIPCERCAFSPCQYRRRPYLHARRTSASASETPGATPASVARPLTPDARYTVNPRALQKWAEERVQLDRRADGSIEARFRFDGTTCSNLGQPLAFDYVVELSSADEGHCVRRVSCAPTPGEEGYRSMCAYLGDADAFMSALASEQPLVGQPLDAVLRWNREATPSGCLCTAGARAHKWGLALEAIHYTLARAAAPAAGSVS